MTNLIVEHTWKPQDGEAVLKVVGGIVDMARNSKLPQGFSLKSVNAIPEQNRAVCNWEAPSKAAMEKLLSDVNPPTSHRVYESMKIF
ncbi:MAG: hypothetical protein QXN66_03550 [Thermoplasmatales archaeon]